MALSQQKFREIVFQLLYSLDMGHPDETPLIELMMGELSVSKKNVRLAQEKVHRIQKLLSEIDKLISSASTSYEFERIQTVTRNILRLGVYELLYDDQIPPKVAIAEAIRLSRKFSTPESASFVNALLDHIHQGKKGDEKNLTNIVEQSQTLMESENYHSKIAQKLSDQKDQQVNNETEFQHDDH